MWQRQSKEQSPEVALCQKIIDSQARRDVTPPVSLRWEVSLSICSKVSPLERHGWRHAKRRCVLVAGRTGFTWPQLRPTHIHFMVRRSLPAA